ncbi:MAG: hypothetical protein DMG33_03755 [Acidobacteria bacterium]|nr:MAG: hypothetical protein DMG33_03755 [Acidobacteriota bacterium]
MRQPRPAAHDQIQMARYSQLLDLHFGQVAAFKLPAHAYARNDRNTHAHLHKAFDALNGRQLDVHIERRAVARKQFDDAPAER